ncbi:MAG TPA: hypothetical protein VFU69_07275, partial [Ktedonobacterales bacterium]|nr:hypothetical protein [Ktedonobacterales bacterium]
MPEWLAPRPPRAQKPATPPAERSGPQRQAAPRPSAERPSDAERDAHLPDWLRAMDPGAPPDLSNLNSGPLRSGGRPSASSYRAPAPDRRSPVSGPTSGADPFSISRVDAALPPLEGFGPGDSGAARRPPTGNPDPFASRPPFSQPPSGQLQRPGDAFPGTKRGLEFPPAGSQRPGGEPSGSWRSENRSGPALTPAASGFSAGSLIEKSALPEWLQGPEQSASAPARPQESNLPPASRSFDLPQAGSSTPRTAGQSGSSGLSPLPSASSPFDGASLVDETSLPDWLRSSSETEPLPLPFTVSESVGRVKFGSENKSSAAPAGGAGAADDDALPEWLQRVYSEANVPPLTEDKPLAVSGPQKISGSDLLDARSVPNWIKEAAQTSPLANISDILAFTPPANQSEGTSRADAQQVPPASTSGPLSAQSLVDEGQLPEWLRHMGNEGAPATQKSAPSPAFESGPAREGSVSGIFSAAELVDTHMLPAWMKGLEPPSGAAGSAQQPAASGSASGQFSAAELIDTYMLPAWLQDQDPKAAPSSFSGAENAGPTGSASGLFSASELVDTAALPVWMKAQESPGAPEAPAAPENAGPTGSASGLFSAAELVDTHALPVWLKDQGPPTGSVPAVSSGSPGQSGPAGSTSGVFSASELVDTAALPVWMKAQDPGSSQTSGGSGALTGRPSGSKITPMPAGFSGQQSGVFSVSELVDTKALPAWLKDAGGESGAAASGGGQDTLARDTEGRMAAAELVDTSALPAWLGGTNAGSPGASSGPGSGGLSASAGAPPAAAAPDQTGGFSAASLVDPDALPEWLKPAQSGPLPSGSAPLNRSSAPLTSQSGAGWGEYSSNEQSGLSGASLVDPDELPEWMRSQEGLQRPGNGPLDGGAEEAPQARVPRRPHLSTEPDRAPSQAAASVFSSVLGPSAGEDQRHQPFGGLSSSSREMPAVDRSNPFSQLSSAAQGQDWGSSEGGWNQPSGASQASGAFRAFDGEQGRGFDQGADWPGSFGTRGMADEPPERDRSSYRALGPLSDSQHMRRVSPPGEPEDEMNGPLTRRQAGRARSDAGFGMAEDQGQERGYRDFSPGPQGRGPQEGYGYRQEYEGWEGGPGYEQGYMD